jgi:ABC-type transport system involved in multi-copper enzyme maturation permease subunit
LTLSPLALLAVVAAIILPLAGTDTLPAVFAILAIVISDIASRDVRAGTMANLYAVPRLRENFVWWKFGATLVFSLIFCAAAILVTASRHPDRLGALLVGIVFVVSIATMLGTVSGNSKTFIVVFLSFWYLVVNDKGETRILDFAGLYGPANARTMFIYAAVSAGAMVLAYILSRVRIAR